MLRSSNFGRHSWTVAAPPLANFRGIAEVVCSAVVLSANSGGQNQRPVTPGASWHCGLFREVDVPSESNFRYKAATVHVAVARGVAETMSSCRFLPRLPSELSAPLFAGGRGGD